MAPVNHIGDSIMMRRLVGLSLAACLLSFANGPARGASYPFSGYRAYYQYPAYPRYPAYATSSCGGPQVYVVPAAPAVGGYAMPTPAPPSIKPAEHLQTPTKPRPAQGPRIIESRGNGS